MKTRETIRAALLEPFAPGDVKWKPQMVKNNRALAMAYIDARAVQDRLDEVLGVDGWEERYKILTDGSVMCRLTIRITDQETNTARKVTKCDVGSPSAQPDVGDRLKAAFSDALKRAAVKFGIGRYLYRLASQWVDYDPVKKAFVNKPQLPPDALPVRFKPAGAELADKVAKLALQYCKDARKNVSDYTADLMRALKYDPKTAVKDMKRLHADAMLRKIGEDMAALAAGQGPGNGNGGGTSGQDVPKDGKTLRERLTAQDKKMADAKQIKVGELVAHVTGWGVKCGYASDIAKWESAAIAPAVDVATAFIKSKTIANTEKHPGGVAGGGGRRGDGDDPAEKTSPVGDTRPEDFAGDDYPEGYDGYGDD